MKRANKMLKSITDFEALVATQKPLGEAKEHGIFNEGDFGV